MHGWIDRWMDVNCEHSKSSSLASDRVLRDLLALYWEPQLEVGSPLRGSPHEEQLWPSKKLLYGFCHPYLSIYNDQYLTLTVCQVLVHPPSPPQAQVKI